MEVIQSAPNGVGESGIPSGCILMWSGSVNTIPNGWKLCDGSNGTPDLRNRFIVGAGNEYSPSDTGGENSVSLTTQQMPYHTHSGGSVSLSIPRVRSDGGIYEGILWNVSLAGPPQATFSASVSIGYSGSGQAHENRPPYYALCFIMKL